MSYIPGPPLAPSILSPYTTLFRSASVPPEVRTTSAGSAPTAAAMRARADSIRMRADWPSACSEDRSEEHTSELQSRGHLVCRLPLEKKNTQAQSFFDVVSATDNKD